MAGEERKTPDLVGGIYKYHEKKIRINPCHSNRASAIGHPCTRYLVYSRVAWAMQSKHDLGLQLIFDEGSNHEKQIMIDLQEAGFEVIEQQISGADARTKISWHLDAIVKHDGRRFPLEFKTCESHIFDNIAKFDRDQYVKAMQTLGETKRWMKKYPAQMLVYLHGKKQPVGIVLFKNKTNGRLHQFDVELEKHLDYLNEIQEKAIYINECVEKFALGTDKEIDVEGALADSVLPERINDREECRGCGFNHLCLPDIDFGEPLKIEDDPGFEDKLDRYFIIEDLAREHEDLNKIINGQVKGVANKIIGKYHISGKADKRGSWRKRIVFINDDDMKKIQEESKKLEEIILKQKGEA